MEITIHPNLTIHKYHDREGPPPNSWSAKRAKESLSRLLPDTPIRLLNEQEASYGDLHHVTQLLAGRVDKPLLERMPLLQWVQFPGSGKDHFFAASGLLESDFEHRGVEVINSPGVNSVATAEHVIAMALALVRGVPRAVRQQDEGRWCTFSAVELRGKTLGIIGLGAIGERVAKLARAFEMTVVASKRTFNTHGGHAHIVQPPSCNEEIIASADFVVLCAPSTPDTASMFDEAMFRRMKPSAYFINVSRGANVVDIDLFNALEEGEIAGAAVDTFGPNTDSESDQPEALHESSPLWGCSNLLIMPNNAAASDRYMDYFAESVAHQYIGRKVGGS
ncbi:NAD(P)-dependent oxidoreductase [Nesterenkonia muleiensis]|uniref:NAD(P)-dependent oxidoreductase n=1 Tax=Nesterenkonia muleiensis TaxID=2282648 RepID=UPI001300B2B6|nr:NAD(P)-dependent oxidoreductase [Nesterenkonia muleiensis]